MKPHFNLSAAVLTVACSFILGGCAAPVREAPPRPTGPAPAVAIERIVRDLDVGAGRVNVRIRNPYGDVHVRNSNTQAVGIRAVAQRIGQEPPQPSVRLERDGPDGVDVAVEVPGVRDGCRDLLPGGWRRARVDLTVFVPPEVAVDVAASCDGRVTAKNVRGDLRARTASGAMDVSAVGRLDLRSESGAVRARQGSGKWRGTARVESVAGPVIVTVPTFSNVALTARGCGDLRGALALAVERRERRGGCWEARARYGAATTLLHVESGGPFVELRGLAAPVN